MFRSFILALCLIGVVVAAGSCNQAEKKKKPLIPENAMFLDYRAWGDEEGGLVNVRLQFRQGGPEGDAILLEEPSHVSWDNSPMLPHNSKMNGFYYEKIIPIFEFSGHSIVFTSIDGKVFETDIDFPVFQLENELPSQVKRGDLLLEIKGLNDKEDLQVLLSDTSFYGRGIDRIFTVKKGELLIPEKYMERLASGPIALEIIREEHRILPQAPEGGGLLTLTYSIKREFELLKMPVSTVNSRKIP